jgi:hypothetical protein
MFFSLVQGVFVLKVIGWTLVLSTINSEFEEINFHFSLVEAILDKTQLNTKRLQALL